MFNMYHFQNEEDILVKMKFTGSSGATKVQIRGFCSHAANFAFLLLLNI